MSFAGIVIGRHTAISFPSRTPGMRFVTAVAEVRASDIFLEPEKQVLLGGRLQARRTCGIISIVEVATSQSKSDD